MPGFFQVIGERGCRGKSIRGVFGVKLVNRLT
jgi:hypothetical protein